MGAVIPGMGGMGGGNSMSNIQNQINQQQMDAASAATSRENTQTAIQKMVQDAQNKKIQMHVEQVNFSSSLNNKLDLSR